MTGKILISCSGSHHGDCEVVQAPEAHREGLADAAGAWPGCGEGLCRKLMCAGSYLLSVLGDGGSRPVAN